MSDEPFGLGRELVDLDRMLASIGGVGWDGLKGEFKPAPVHDAFRPADSVQKFGAAAFRTAEGRAFFEWIADLTLRAPLSGVGPSFQSAALAAAKHEARQAIGRVIFKGLAEGERLLSQKETPDA